MAATPTLTSLAADVVGIKMRLDKLEGASPPVVVVPPPVVVVPPPPATGMSPDGSELLPGGAPLTNAFGKWEFGAKQGNDFAVLLNGVQAPGPAKALLMHIHDSGKMYNLNNEGQCWRFNGLTANPVWTWVTGWTGFVAPSPPTRLI